MIWKRPHRICDVVAGDVIANRRDRSRILAFLRTNVRVRRRRGLAFVDDDDDDDECEIVSGGGGTVRGTVFVGEMVRMGSTTRLRSRMGHALFRNGRVRRRLCVTTEVDEFGEETSWVIMWRDSNLSSCQNSELPHPIGSHRSA